WREGIITVEPPRLGKAFPVRVPQVDADGNEVAGVRGVELLAPLATYAPWSLRGGIVNADELVDFYGTLIPFPRDRAERERTGDPRPSLVERYGDRKRYLELVTRHAETQERTGLLLADLYRPRNPRAAVRLVHGLSPAGKRHPQLVRLARVFTRQGFMVMVPHFDGLATFRLSGQEIDEIKAALAELRRRSAAVAVAGFSFGAGPALVAAAETDGLAWVGSFGGYADLRNVIVYLTSGVHMFQHHRYAGRVEEYNRWKLAALLTPFVQDEPDRER